MPRRSFTRPAIRASRSNFSAETSVCGLFCRSLQPRSSHPSIVPATFKETREINMRFSIVGAIFLIIRRAWRGDSRLE